ncbi:MAG: hydrogenase formation protein HypD [Gammaproteobacteria bacterium]|nr:hydrogenase formation protein HypD [Gammaproteobacteria bacterium]
MPKSTPIDIKSLLHQLQTTLPADQHVKIIHVCGGHERTINQAALRPLLPANIELIAGPGCPVCVCPEQDIATAIALSLQPGMRVVCFGDMLRVPINSNKHLPKTLLKARELGADVQFITSPMEVITLAQQHASKKIIFFAAGFETTMAPIAALLSQPLPDNFFFLLSGRRTSPIVRHLLQHEKAYFQAVIIPGHTSVITGIDEWQFLAQQQKLPCAIAGFEIHSFIRACNDVLQQIQHGDYRLSNCYQGVTTSSGNAFAQQLMQTHFSAEDSVWRGIGKIKDSGYQLAPQHQHRDARQFMSLESINDDMPKGCECHHVVLGKIYPDQCRLYGRGCTPTNPIGPCMVSDEGACQLWWRNGVRHHRAIS